MSSQSIYVSLSILSLIGLAGAGVAVGSGVAMMSMAALEHEAGKPAVAAHSVAEARKAPLSRGFASRGAQ